MDANALRTTQSQLEYLSQFEPAFEKLPETENGLSALTLETVQINLGKQCNQSCKHCHVDAGPTRTESMSEETARQCLEIIKLPNVKCVDITGGAPEMNGQFKFLVEESKKMGKHVMDRCNLTILEEPGYEYLYEFLAQHRVEIVASLPHFAASTTDRQRGKGVFDKSILALKKLNALGYGKNLPLHLVYNPAGFFMSAPQSELEPEFKNKLKSQYGIEFNNLYCIHNIPINRFLMSLVARGKFESYMETLANAYNPATLEGLMCRHQISISYEGYVYDCDFNQMLDLKANGQNHISQFNLQGFLNRKLAINSHCYACTAGAGSSCGGNLS